MFGKPYFNERRDDYTQNFVGENDINMNIDVDMINTGAMGAPMMSAAPAMPMQPMMGTVTPPIVEPMHERVVNRTILHEVPHICPNRTKVINNHVYRHTYRPTHSCCEENVVTNIQCGTCDNTPMNGPCC